MRLSGLYKMLVYRDNRRLNKAMESRQTRCFDLLLLAQNILVDGEALYQANFFGAGKGMVEPTQRASMREPTVPDSSKS